MTTSSDVLICSDVHLREESAPVVLGQVMPGIRRICRDRGLTRVFCLGDFWHLRYRVPVALQNAMLDALRSFAEAGIAWTFLPGNHDQVDVQGRNALEVFHELDNVTVHSEPTWTADGLWVPYRSRIEQIAAALQTPIPAGLLPSSVCFLHYGVRGALRNNHMLDTDGAPPEMFQNFATVLCGHYHKRQSVNHSRIWYIGSPWQTRADEAGDPKGVAIWDGRQLTFLDQAWGPRFHKSRLAGLADVAQLPVPTTGDDYRITIPADMSVPEVAQALEARGITRYTITPEVADFEARMPVPEGESLEAYAQQYLALQVDAAAHEEREALWRIFEALTEGKHDGTVAA